MRPILTPRVFAHHEAQRQTFASVSAKSSHLNSNGAFILIGHGADETTVGGGNGFIKGRAFRLVVENGYQRGCVDDDHRGKPKSS